MTLAIPEEIASRLTTLLPTTERDEFALSAISEALNLIQAENSLADMLLEEYDPATDPEHEAAECRRIVGTELAEMKNAPNLITLDEAERRWSECETKSQTVS